ncbi:hypothetical protein D5266_00890 [bacterium c-19]|nr:hypothetical protein [bacterium c-19]
MLKNERGFLLIDVITALSLVMIMLLILVCALQIRAQSMQSEENLDIYEIYEAGTRIYND